MSKQEVLQQVIQMAHTRSSWYLGLPHDVSRVRRTEIMRNRDLVKLRTLGRVSEFFCFCSRYQCSSLPLPLRRLHKHRQAKRRLLPRRRRYSHPSSNWKIGVRICRLIRRAQAASRLPIRATNGRRYRALPRRQFHFRQRAGQGPTPWATATTSRPRCQAIYPKRWGPSTVSRG